MLVYFTVSVTEVKNQLIKQIILHVLKNYKMNIKSNLCHNNYDEDNHENLILIINLYLI